ncbi:MAG: peptidyl-prolyl cis-trans isomerase [Firmicutes bacterium]|nr:peptidyl-prolyl cis-trans isomerase [Bacillota bacterium]MCM1401756.1 peptidyl-prolyl cis-trans isomerase [Bacteroides sp.]MCM1476903.1 peptidyl-prolyl cis-trans isomerase [Bacteroides sp.]
MKKTPMVITAAALALASATFAAKQDNGNKVVMNIGPEKVTLEEFEYLYNKNNKQQASQTSLDEYIDMFVNYKMKVLAAKDAGFDTTQAYLQDLEKYTEELARPYLRTEAVDDSLLNVAFKHTQEMVDVDHILIPAQVQGKTPRQQKQLADSVREAIANGADFGEMAKKFSSDKAAASRNGHLGYVIGGMWPYTFEDLAFNTPVGQLSEVKQSPYGFHIVRVINRTPNPGMIKARHILKMTRGMDAEGEARQKKSIDSLYNVVTSGANFAEVAKQNTDEESGQETGGDLPWFATGQMVEEFSNAAFALQPGEISKPVKTAFGWHIILCEDRRGVQPMDSIKDKIRKQILNDERSILAVQRTLDNWKAKQGVTNNPEGEKIVNVAFANPALSAVDVQEALSTSETPLAYLGKDAITVAKVAKSMKVNEKMSLADTRNAFDNTLAILLNNLAVDQYIATLPSQSSDYKNLLDEYRDGILLYEISNSEIWDKANTDSIGLQRYYENHITDFAWDKPHYKGMVIAATNDSIADAALEFLTNNMDNLAKVTSTQNIRKRFGNEVKLERVLAGRGDNAIVDFLSFGGPKPEMKGRWKTYRNFNGKIINAPEDARDVKGQVSIGYQQQLETEWLKKLHNKYKVKIDRKAIHKALD